MTRTRLETSIQHFAGIPPAVEAPTFTPGEDVTVNIGCQVSDETIRISIGDDGPGIPDDQKEDIFGRGQKSLDAPAAGLGLYLIDNVVDSYSGEMWLKDNGPTGSVFVVELNRVCEERTGE